MRREGHTPLPPSWSDPEDMETNEDPDLLAEVLRGAWSVKVYNGGCRNTSHGSEGREEPLQEAPVLHVEDQRATSALAELLSVTHVSSDLCRCWGSETIEFLDAAGARIAILGLHHGTALRWSRWRGDAPLVAGPSVLHWLAERGYSLPLERYLGLAEQEEEHKHTRAAWIQAVPACLHEMLQEMLTTTSTAISSRVQEQLERQVPDEVERCRLLLNWYSAGTGRCSGYPVYEGVPGAVLKETELETVLAVLQEEEPGSRAWEGALRHLADWRSRTETELSQIPEDVWEELLHLARSGPEKDKQRRIEGKRPQL